MISTAIFFLKKLIEMVFNLGCTAEMRLRKKKEHSNQESEGGYVREIGLRRETGSMIVSW